ncbi:MAG: hypothetical protein WC905_01505 [Patescibacteria group bacterium]|jgi:2C-methyl-D-erythritol 2,4-cyclodiphosphate synthase
MAKIKNIKESISHKYLREFVNSIIEKNYAIANANLNAAMNEKLKARVTTVLQENP